MIERSTQPGSGAPLPSSAGSARAMDELRRLLVGQEQAKLASLERRIVDAQARTEDVSTVLPQAILRCGQRDTALAHALAPSIEQALRSSIKRDPGILSNAIFPVVGPAVRRSLGDALRRIVEAFDHALEHSLSVRGLKWRFEAWRTGRPFAEVVLRHTLIYRVEQVFLIHRQSGLLLLHVAAPGAGTGDEDLISSMLTAIRDFVADSFQSAPLEELNAIQVGQFHLWIESGPHATLAIAFRGEAPVELRQRLQRTLEVLHENEAEALSTFDGETARFELSRPALEDCLQARFVESGRRRFPWRALGVMLAASAVMSVWIWHRAGDRRRERALVSRLSTEPGIVVLEVERSGGALRIRGLRDPEALDPDAVVRAVGMTPGEEVFFDWRPFLALAPELTLRRAESRLEPPSEVRLSVSNQTLRVAGRAPMEWWQKARAAAQALPGVDRVDDSGLEVDTGDVESLAGAIGREAVHFDVAASVVTSDLKSIARVVDLVQAFAARAQGVGKRWVLVVTGHADGTGSGDINLKLSQQRAEWIKDRLVDAGLPAEWIETTGAGSSVLARPEAPEAPENRRATFAVRWAP